MQLLPALAGLAFGLSLIVAIGAQNAFVLRRGLRGHRVGTVVAVCAASDVVLIALGVAGAGALLRDAPEVVDVARIGGSAFLIGYAALAARLVWRPGTLHASPDEDAPRRGRTLAAALAFTWLNPHVYLDTLVLLGSVAAAHGDGRWSFGLGAMCGSVLWFSSLGYGARLLRRPFARPEAWRALDGAIALIMTATAVSLVT
jgi:L-lysine exporter family protein LysE/ArgO